jgi:DNA-binding transcriptional LysR family regulator
MRHGELGQPLFRRVGHGAALASTVCAAPYLHDGGLVVLDGPSFSQSAYRMHCDLRTYDDAQVRRVYDWFIRECATTRPENLA